MKTILLFAAMAIVLMSCQKNEEAEMNTTTRTSPKTEMIASLDAQATANMTLVYIYELNAYFPSGNQVFLAAGNYRLSLTPDDGPYIRECDITGVTGTGLSFVAYTDNLTVKPGANGIVSLKAIYPGFPTATIHITCR